MKKESKSLCAECGIAANVITCLQRYGRPPQKLAFSVSTFHKGICMFCGEEKSVTEQRDFFYPDLELLRNTIAYMYNGRPIMYGEKSKPLIEEIEQVELPKPNMDDHKHCAKCH